jgi:hypothetical protein
MLQPPQQSFQHETTPAMRDFEEAYLTYIRALQEAGIPSGAQQAIMDAYGHYVATLQQPWLSEDLQTKATDAYRRYAEALHSAFASDALHRRAEDACRMYARALRDAWVRLDNDAMNAETLMAISQTMSIVATIAAAAQNGPASTTAADATATKTT